MSSQFRHRASLLLNIVLAVTALVIVLPRPEPAPAASVKLTNEPPVTEPLTSNQPQSPRYPDVASASDQRRWLIDQLRAMGLPNKVLARVALEDLEKRQNTYAAEISKKFYGDPDTLAAVQLQFDQSLDAEMRAALGEADFRQWDQGNMLREADSGKVPLTSSETDAVYDLWKKLRQHQLDLAQAKVERSMDPADISDAYAKADSEFEQQMKALLGAERYAKSQGIDEGSATASLRQGFAEANPSDAQFQELLQAQQQWNGQRLALDQQFQNDPSSSAYAAQLRALDDARDQEYRRVLGDDVFATLQKEQDPGYNQMKKYETLWGLDDNQINSVYGAIKYYEKGVQDYQAQASALQAQGKKVDWDAVNRNLQQFANQTLQALQDYAGQDTFNKMQKNGVFSLSPPTLPLAHSKPSQ